MKAVWLSLLFPFLRYAEADPYLPAKKDGSMFLQHTGNNDARLYETEMNVTMDIRSQFEIEFFLNTMGKSNDWVTNPNNYDASYMKAQDLLRLGKTKISYALNGELAISHYINGEDKLFTTTQFYKGDSRSSNKYVKISQLKNAEGKHVFTVFWKTTHKNDQPDISETITAENTTPYAQKDGQFERYKWQNYANAVFSVDGFRLGSLRVTTHDCSADNYFDGQQCRRYPIIRRKDEFSPVENNPIAFFPLRKQFELEFELNPGNNIADWHNVIRVGFPDPYNNFYGARSPLIYTYKNGLAIYRSISGKLNEATPGAPNYLADTLSVNQWTKIRITQLLTEDGKYQYEIHVADKLQHTEIDEKPTEISSAMMWAGDPAHLVDRLVKIRNLRFVSHDCPFGHYLDDNSSECKKGQKVDVDWSSWIDCVKDCYDKISTGGGVRSLLFDYSKFPTKNDMTGNKDGSLILQNMGQKMVYHPFSQPNGQVGKAPIQINSQFEIEFQVTGWDLREANKIMDAELTYTVGEPLKLMRMGKTLIAYGGSQFVISHFVNGTMMTFTTKNVPRMIAEGQPYIHVRLTEFKNKEGKYEFTIYVHSSLDSGNGNDWKKGIFLKNEPEKYTLINTTPYTSHISEFERYPMPRQLYRTYGKDKFRIYNVKVSTHNCALGEFFDGKRCSRYSTFEHKDEIDVVRSKVLAVFPMFKQFDLEVEVWLPGDITSCWYTILGVGPNIGWYGYSNPHFLYCYEKIILDSAVNGDIWPHKEIKPEAKKDQWQRYRASQLKDKEGRLMLTWEIDGVKIASKENIHPAEGMTAVMSTAPFNNVVDNAKIRNVRYVGHDCSEHQYFNEKNPTKCYENRHRFDEKDGWTTKIGYSKAKLFCEERNLELCSTKDLCPKQSKIQMEDTDAWVAALSSSGPVTIQIGSRKENGSPNFCQTHTDALGSRADWHDKDTDAEGNGFPFRGVMFCCGKKGEWSPWSDASSCTKTCDKGTTRRTRQCYNQKPNDFGCEGSDTEIKPCNEHGCPFQMCDVKSAENKVTCDDKKMTIKLAKCFSDPKMKISLKDDKCKAVVSGTSVVLESGLEQCGMTMSSDEEHIVFENTLVLQTTEKTSDDKPGLIFTPKIKVRCKFPASSSTNMKLTVTVDNTESTTGVGVFEFVADSYTDDKFEVTSDKPTVVGSQVYLGVKPKAPLPSDLSFYVTKCTVSNASTSYNILNDRCPNTVVRGEADKGDSKTLFKIKYYAFQFHDSADKEVTSYDVACTVRLCLKGKCPVQPTCP